MLTLASFQFLSLPSVPDNAQTSSRVLPYKLIRSGDRKQPNNGRRCFFGNTQLGEQQKPESHISKYTHSGSEAIVKNDFAYNAFAVNKQN